MISQRQEGPIKEEEEAAKKWGLRQIKGKQGKGLGRSCLHYGSQSGYQAINFAYLEGAATIILLGFDMQKTNGQAHFFGDHPDGLSNGPDFDERIPEMKALAEDLAAEGVEVINCTRETALTCFKRATIDTCIRR